MDSCASDSAIWDVRSVKLSWIIVGDMTEETCSPRWKSRASRTNLWTFLAEKFRGERFEW
jgi:hypothetical protein